MLEPKFEVQTKIRRPVREVFKALVDPEMLCQFFTKTTSGALVEGATVHWTWYGYKEEIPVVVKKVVKEKLIVLEWEPSSCDGKYHLNYKTTIEISFSELDHGKTTMLSVKESGWEMDQAGLDSSYDHCQGWQHMNTCLKALLEHDIDIRDKATS